MPPIDVIKSIGNAFDALSGYSKVRATVSVPTISIADTRIANIYLNLVGDCAICIFTSL